MFEGLSNNQNATKYTFTLQSPFKDVTFTYAFCVSVRLNITLNDKVFGMQYVSLSSVNPLRMKNLNSYIYPSCTSAVVFCRP
jgi:hypothetical protein